VQRGVTQGAATTRSSSALARSPADADSSSSRSLASFHNTPDPRHPSYTLVTPPHLVTRRLLPAGDARAVEVHLGGRAARVLEHHCGGAGLAVHKLDVAGDACGGWVVVVGVGVVGLEWESMRRGRSRHSC